MNKHKFSAQRARERAVFRYRSALERGDFETVSEVLKMAERDAVLMQMIDEIAELDEGWLTRPEQNVTSFFRDSKGITQFVIRRDTSLNGWTPKPDHNEEDNAMNSTTFSDSIRRGKYGLSPNFLTLIAASVLIVLLGSLLFRWVSTPIGSYGTLIEPSPTPSPAGCQVLNAADTQAESLRLAQADTDLLKADKPDADLTALLGICALQTAYSPEADAALQQALDLKGESQQFKGHTWYVNGLAFSPDGQYLYSGSADKYIRTWNLQSGEETAAVQVGDDIFSMALSPDGRYLATGNYRSTAHLWDLTTQKLIHKFIIPGEQVVSIAFSQDRNYLLTGSYLGSVKLWNLTTGEEIQAYAGWFGAISPDSSSVATFDHSGHQLNVYDIGTKALVKSINTTMLYAALAFSPDGRYLLVGEDTAQSVDADNPRIVKPAAIQLFDIATGTEARRFEGHNGEISGAIFSPDGKYILSGSYDGTARLWDAETGDQLRIFTADEGEVVSVAISPDGRSVAAGYETGLVKLWATDYHDFIATACSKVTRDFTAEERAQYGLNSTVPTCPQFGLDYVLPPGMTSMPTQPIPVWTPLPPIVTPAS